MEFTHCLYFTKCIVYDCKVYTYQAKHSVVILPSLPPHQSVISSHFFMGEGRRRRFQKWAVAKWMEWPTGDWPSNPGGRNWPTTSLISLKVGQESSHSGFENSTDNRRFDPKKPSVYHHFKKQLAL